MATYATAVAQYIEGQFRPAGYEFESDGFKQGAIQRMLSQGLIVLVGGGGATAKNSVEIDDGDIQLVGDADAPGNDKVYGTDGTGTKGWKDDPSGGGDDTGNVLGGTATGDNSVAVGSSASAGNTFRSIAVGAGATTSSADATTVGRGSSAAGSAATLGADASAGTNGVAVGRQSSAGTNWGDVAVGRRAAASGARTVAVGHDSTASATEAVAVGESATAGHNQSVALGRSAATTAVSQVAIGPRHIELRDVTTPATPTLTTAARLGVRDNAGTQELVVVFGDGTVKVLADDV